MWKTRQASPHVFRLALALPLASCLSGCFFIYIPPSVIGSVSDAVTGQTGDNCIRDGLNVGDHVALANGQIFTVTSISGHSDRCTNPNLPIRAMLTADTAATEEEAARLSKVNIKLPAGWDTSQPPSNVLNSKSYALNRTIDAGMLFAVIANAGIVDLRRYAETQMVIQSTSLNNADTSDISELKIGSRKAWRFYVTGDLKTNGHRFVYLVTIIAGSSGIAIVTTWTSEALYSRNKQEMSDLANFVTGLQ